MFGPLAKPSVVSPCFLLLAVPCFACLCPEYGKFGGRIFVLPKGPTKRLRKESICTATVAIATVAMKNPDSQIVQSVWVKIMLPYAVVWWLSYCWFACMVRASTLSADFYRATPVTPGLFRSENADFFRFGVWSCGSCRSVFPLVVGKGFYSPQLVFVGGVSPLRSTNKKGS